MTSTTPLTTEMRAELAEVDAERKSRLLEVTLNSIDQGFVVWDDDECMVICNDRFLEIWKYPKELAKPGVRAIELLRYDAKQGEHGDDGDVEAQAELRNKKAQDHHQNEQDELFTTRSGRVLYIRRYSIAGLGHVTTFTDITELKKTEAALDEKTRLLESTLNSIDQGVAIWSDDDQLAISNDRFRELLGYPAALAKPGTQSIDFIRYLAERGDYGEGDPEELAQAYLKNAIEYHDQGDAEQFTTHDNRTLYVRRYGAKDSSAVTTYTDITDLKKTEDALLHSEEQLQEQVHELKIREEKLEAQTDDLISLTGDLERSRLKSEQLNKQKDKFFSIIAHDLIGPFNSLLGYTSMLSNQMDMIDKVKVAEAAVSINRSAENLFKLLENLLEWSRLQMGRVEFEPEIIDLGKIIDENLDLFSPLAEQKNISLGSESSSGCKAFADPHMVDAIIRNLINNALKFTSENGSISIVVECSEKWTQISCVDTGVGMSPGKIDRLFRLEEKVSTVGTGGETGTGLGLQLCKEFAETQGGKIEVESTEGKGSTFHVTLPGQSHL